MGNTMNKKIVSGAVAGVAALALAAGGSTFAAWSDFDSIDDTSAAADELTLVLDPSNSFGFDNTKLAPGEEEQSTKMLVNRTGSTVTNASLTMAMTDLLGTEDGCTSTNSEQAIDPDCETRAGETSPTAGNFIDQAVFSVSTGAPVNGVCGGSSTRTNKVFTDVRLADIPARGKTSLLAAGDTLTKNEALCVGVSVKLPKTANDASQGDSASFDLDFELKQII